MMLLANCEDALTFVPLGTRLVIRLPVSESELDTAGVVVRMP